MSPPFSLYELNPELPPVEVLDVGAFEDPKWPPPYAALRRDGRARVTGFEPDLPACLRLGNKFQRPHRFFPLFIGDGRPAKYYATSREQTGSLFEPNAPVLELFRGLHEVTELQRVKDVTSVRLDDLPQIGDVDYLKIDAQGSELDAFRGGAKLLESVVVIHTEVAFEALYRDQPLFGEVDAYLRSQGFWLHLFPGLDTVTMKPFDSDGRQVLWTDVVYTRHPLRLSGLAELKLWKLAVVLHDIYRACDFAHACLREIDARGGGGVAAAYRARLALPAASLPSPRLVALDHVQLAMPPDREAEARGFYTGVLGLPEIVKPPHLAKRGGCWFERGSLKLHLGVEQDFRPGRKAHPAFVVADLPSLVAALEAAGRPINRDEPLEGYDRIFTDDPFGNRIELMEPSTPAPPHHA
jgi:FkbM family methyltransferase